MESYLNHLAFLQKKYIGISLFLFTLFFSFTTYAKEQQATTVIFEQEFDWVKLNSKEWLKGNIISMYDEELEFDSKKLDLQTIDWEDVEELRSKNWQSIRMQNGIIAEGYLVVKDGQLSLVKYGETRHFELSDVLSIAASRKNRRDFWDAYVNLGMNLRKGNTVQFDYTLSGGLQRRSASSRFKMDYIVEYSKYEEQSTEEEIVTANSDRLTSTYDWFFNQRVYFRALDFEYLSDEFLNIDYRIRYGIAVGYHLIDNSLISWDVNIGPSYQTTQFIEVKEGESDRENSPGLTIGTDYTYEITDDIDFNSYYSVQIVNEASGNLIHHFETGLKVELTSDFDLDLTFYADRTENPKEDGSENIPEKNDYRMVVSLGYDF